MELFELEMLALMAVSSSLWSTRKFEFGFTPSVENLGFKIYIYMFR